MNEKQFEVLIDKLSELTDAVNKLTEKNAVKEKDEVKQADVYQDIIDALKRAQPKPYPQYPQYPQQPEWQGPYITSCKPTLMLQVSRLV